MIVLAAIAAGAIGAPSRYLLERAAGTRVGHRFPWGTLLVNVSGSLALGVLVGLVLHHGLDPDLRTVAGTGFLGGYTTFSTYAYETVRLGPTRRAVTYAVVSTVAGIGAAAAGLALASA